MVPALHVSVRPYLSLFKGFRRRKRKRKREELEGCLGLSLRLMDADGCPGTQVRGCRMTVTRLKVSYASRALCAHAPLAQRAVEHGLDEALRLGAEGRAAGDHQRHAPAEEGLHLGGREKTGAERV